MPSSRRPEFIETIEPTWENAKAVQKLTLQDLKAGGFPNPLELADPNNDDKVKTQQQKLLDHPERYSGYVREGQLVAYIKQNEWLKGDEMPFATLIKAIKLVIAKARHLDPSTGQWGIFGLVAADDLDSSVREDVLTDLLIRSFTDPLTGEERTVNIPIHKHDPLLTIAPHYDFVAVGKLGEAAGAPGVKQWRYQRVAT